ncbi:hypothetical protein BRC86_01885 [Halobacteriales archaeon QS_3_64_16]|nr:MAG: hypothetical protein BRC86_01885 [Halobacteriales archaeon QS_3_64_16]
MTDNTDRGRSAERASELIDRVGGQSASRRAFLGNTAKVGGGALALSATGAGSAAAKSGINGDDSGMDEDMNGDGEVTDLDVLNFALTLEHLEAEYYNEFLSEYSEHEVETSSVAKVLTGGGNDRYTIYQKIEQVRDHEEAHVDALTKTINDLGGEPVEPLEYAFPYETIEDFAALSATIEAVGVSAYAGAGPLIESEAVVKAALSIHSVEARHTAYFNVLNTTNPFPDAFDEPRTMEEVLAIATDFIVS